MYTETMYHIPQVARNISRTAAWSVWALLIISGAFVFHTHTAQALGLDLLTLGSAQIELDPPYPSPGTRVEATFRSTALDIYSTNVTWTMDKKVVLRASGDTRYHFIAGPIGSVMVLSATAHDAEGVERTATAIIRVSDVSLVWEGRTYTPPFYLGRALSGGGGSLVVLALPVVPDSSGQPTATDQLYFEWHADDGTTPFAYGLGKAAVLYRSRPLSTEPPSVSVVVKDINGAVRAARTISVPVTDPSVVLYEDDPLYGIGYDRALGNEYPIAGRAVSLVAEPYYFSVPSRTDTSLTYAWEVGEQTLENAGSITLSPGGDGGGVSPLRVAVTHNTVWQQRADASTQIAFTAASTPNTMQGF